VYILSLPSKWDIILHSLSVSNAFLLKEKHVKEGKGVILQLRNLKMLFLPGE
jgi:hypothetical protein